MYRQIGYRVGIFLSVGMSLPYVFIQASDFLMVNPGRGFCTGVCAGLICALTIPFRLPLPDRDKSTQQRKRKTYFLLGLFAGAFYLVIACLGASVISGDCVDLFGGYVSNTTAGIFLGTFWGAGLFSCFSPKVLFTELQGVKQ